MARSIVVVFLSSIGPAHCGVSHQRFVIWLSQGSQSISGAVNNLQKIVVGGSGWEGGGVRLGEPILFVVGIVVLWVLGWLFERDGGHMRWEGMTELYLKELVGVGSREVDSYLVLLMY